MGHRVLVAVERDAGTFDCFRSDWAGAQVFDRHPREVIEATVAVGRPVRTKATVRDVLRALDPQLDDALVVGTATDVEQYLVRHLEVPLLDMSRESDERGAPPTILVPVVDRTAAERLDVALRTAKGVLGDAVDADLVPPRLAEGYLAVLVARHPDVPDGAIWLGEEVVG